MSELLGKFVETDGKKGKAVGFDDRSGNLLVETFDGLSLEAAPDKVQQFEPEAPEQGGFHVAWPLWDEEMPDFAAQMVEVLRNRDYCVIQMFMDDEKRAEAMQEAAPSELKYKRMKKELEGAYLGRQFKCKTAWMDGLAEEKEEMEGVLDTCDMYFSNLTRLLVPLAPCALDFTPYSRTSALVRTPVGREEESKYSSALREVDEDDIDEGLIESHIDFLKRRQLCMLFIIETGGGEMKLIPKDDGKESIALETVKGRLIVFRHDRLSYVYNPFDSNDLVMQSWIMSPPESLEFFKLEGDQKSKDEILGIVTGAHTPDGMRTNIFGTGIGIPAGVDNGLASWWGCLIGGTDGQIKAPLSRFDIDIYYRPNDEWFPGTTYTMHGGFCCHDIYAFDNKLFNVPEEDCTNMAVAQKVILENAYEAAYRSGETMETLKNRNIGVFVGHSGDDWSFTDVYTLGPEDRFKKGHEFRIWASIPGRVCFALGLKGPQMLIDTACSSSLVAYGIGHTMMRGREKSQHAAGLNNGLNEALMCGANMIPGPGNYIGLSGPHMLSVMGRCFTFNASADGFERGEGSGSFFVKNEEVMSLDACGTVIGSCLNQDGRSASMTAPNGPSQSECIRGSMKEAGLTADQVNCAECHGTGTALGDPIEVGALRAVMQDRAIPFLQTSAKTHIGHMEAGAGMAGVLKCIAMCAACAGSPNCHLLVLNPHLDVAGYPTLFATELSDYGCHAGYSGVSSFGFGGANSRADIFAACDKGHHRTGEIDYDKLDFITVKCPIDEGPMNFLDGRMVPSANSKHYQRKHYRADAIRDEFASYDFNSSLYGGKYQLEPREAEEADDPPEDPVYIVGSWDTFQEPREMEVGDSDGTWTFLVALGETRCERFQLRVDKSPDMAIFPIVKNGSRFTRVGGPNDEGAGLYWLLDGRDEEVPAGTVYRITLEWTNPLRVSWERVDQPAPDWALSYKHVYSVMGTFNSWTFKDLEDVSGADGERTFQAKVRIGMSGRESFRFARDHDPQQLIYPASSRADEHTPVRGPDELCNDKRWTVYGRTGALVTLRLQVRDGHLSMSVIGADDGAMMAHSVEGTMRHSYHITGSFNNWGLDEMQPDSETPGVFRYRGTVGMALSEVFTVVVDADPGLALFPESPGPSLPGEFCVRGPMEPQTDKLFQITALKEHATFEVVLARNAVDKRKIVTVEWPEFDRVDPESMKAAVYNYFA